MVCFCAVQRNCTLTKRRVQLSANSGCAPRCVFKQILVIFKKLWKGSNRNAFKIDTTPFQEAPAAPTKSSEVGAPTAAKAAPEKVEEEVKMAEEGGEQETAAAGADQTAQTEQEDK